MKRLGWLVILIISIFCLVPGQVYAANCRAKLSRVSSPDRLTELKRIARESQAQYEDNFSDGVVSLFQGDPIEKLAPNELRSLEDYLRGTLINSALRGHHDAFFKVVSIDPFLEMIASLDSALEKLVPYPGVCFRGYSVPDEVLKNLRAGQLWSDKGFLSASASFWTAARFGTARFSNLRKVLFVLDSEKGRVVPQKFYHRKEYEILFPRETSFEILGVNRRHDPILIYLGDTTSVSLPHAVPSRDRRAP